MIDYEEIIEQLDDNKIKNMLDKLSIPYEDKGSYLLMPTVCHHENIEEASNKLYYYKNTHIFQCYSECGAQSVFSFLKHYYETRNIEYDWYIDIYQLILGCSDYVQSGHNEKYHSISSDYNVQKKFEPLQTYPNGILNVFTKYYPIEWLKEGITESIMDKYNIYFSKSQNKIIIPHYNINGELVGIRGRALNEWEIENVAKYMPVQIENKWYSHPLSLNLYGLNLTKENIKNQGIAFLVEGEKSVMLAENFNFPNCCAAVCGSKLNKFALNILIKNCYPKEVVICFDKEELPHEDIYFNKLYNICKTYNNYCNFSFIYDRENLLNLKDSPFDKGEDIFMKLFAKRVKVS